MTIILDGKTYFYFKIYFFILSKFKNSIVAFEMKIFIGDNSIYKKPIILIVLLVDFSLIIGILLLRIYFGKFY
jgi:hypothetical protein